MKQLVQNYKSGQLVLCETPAPQLRPGGILVRTAYSLISAGTERAMVEMARKNLVGKAMSRPDLVRKVMDKAKTEGLLSAYKKAMLRLSTDTPLGYSSAGTVLAVGGDITGVKPGMRVACGGIGYASHAELAYVPRNLFTVVPDDLEVREAAFTTVGSIALQGIRMAKPALGEVVAVIGLGLVGLLTAQILKANGCGVVGVDPDARRRELAAGFGVDATGEEPGELLDACLRLSGGVGADVVLITAATESSEPLHLAAELSRDRARIVVVGQVGMDVPRKLYYEKELTLLMSRSYGPGRYDRGYEDKGNDYPAGYVRWTENRNMAAVVELMAQRKLDVRSLITHEYPLDRALAAYEMIVSGSERYLGVVLKYEESAVAETRVIELSQSRKEAASVPGTAETIGVGVLGAGSFCTGVILPALGAIPGLALRGICSQGGLNARTVADRWKFAYCTSDVNEILNDPQTQCVLITTRPDSHAHLICAALEAGKHVFVEKPLAVSLAQLALLRKAVAAHPSQVLMVGFNRRFAPFMRQAKEFLGRRSGPLTAVYRVNAGALLPGDWQRDAEQGGGRIVGECGHFVDTLSYLADSPPTEVSASGVAAEGDASPSEDAAMTIRFADGSVGVVVYTTHGSPAFSKERLEIFANGAVAVIDDFRKLELYRAGTRKKRTEWLKQDKGHQTEIAAFLRSAREGTAEMTSDAAFQATLCTLLAVESMRAGVPQAVSGRLLETEPELEESPL